MSKTTGERVTVDAVALNLLRSAVDQINDYTPAYIRRTCDEAIATARPLPSREAVEAAVGRISSAYYSYATCQDAQVPVIAQACVAARAALFALIYGDDAPGGGAA